MKDLLKEEIFETKSQKKKNIKQSQLKVLAVRKEKQDRNSIKGTAEQVQTQARAKLGQTQP